MFFESGNKKEDCEYYRLGHQADGEAGEAGEQRPKELHQKHSLTPRVRGLVEGRHRPGAMHLVGSTRAGIGL
jgi:hypothetical protein